MIAYSNAFLLSAAAPSLRYPRIGYQTWTFERDALSVVVSSEAPGAPRDAPLTPDTGTYWQPSALPATWVVDLGAVVDIDYVGLAGGTLGSSGAAVSVSAGADNDFDARLSLPGIAGNYGSTPDSTALDITGDIDVRVKLAAMDWTPAADAYLINKNGLTTAGGYYLRLLTTGVLQLGWSTGAAAVTADSTVPTGVTDGAMKWVRATLDINNGAGGYDVKFYTSDDGVAWAQLGSTVTGGAPTSIGNSSSQLAVGMSFDASTGPFTGNVYYADVRSGLDGFVVAKFDPSEGLTDGTSIASGSGETWTIHASGATPARLINWRFGGAVAPADDAPILFLDTQRSARFLQLSVSGGAVMPKISVVYAGKALAMMREADGSGFAPVNLSRNTVLSRTLSRGGQFLGQGFRRHGVSSMVNFRHLDPDWYRSSFDPFVKSARRYPYFFAWWPEAYPGEVSFVWTDKDISGKYMGQREWMQVGWNMQGVGNV